MFSNSTGTTSYSGSSSSTLKEVTVPVWPLKDCQNVYGKEKINEKQICAGLKQGGKGKVNRKLIYNSTSFDSMINQIIFIISYVFADSCQVSRETVCKKTTT